MVAITCGMFSSSLKAGMTIETERIPAQRSWVASRDCGAGGAYRVDPASSIAAIAGSCERGDVNQIKIERRVLGGARAQQMCSRQNGTICFASLLGQSGDGRP